MALTDSAIRTAKPQAKPYKMADDRGLFLLVQPSGGKLWRLKYRVDGKEKKLGLGTYPEVSLKEARERRDEARKSLANGVDPGAVKQAQKAAAKAGAGADSFEAIAREWFAKHESRWSPAYRQKIARNMEKDLFPVLGHRSIAELKPLDVLTTVQLIEKRGALETAHFAMQTAGQVFRHGVATGRCERNVTVDLKGALPPSKVTHMAALTDPKDVAAFLRAVDAFNGTFQVQCALRLLPLLFCRPGELRQAEWAEFDLEAGVWNVPAERMKLRKPHLVPLSEQALAIFRDLHMLTGRGRHVLPGRDPKKPMSNMAVNAALRRMGYDTKSEITGHGFRAMARTLLHEQLRFDPAIIEHQLAHRVPDALGAAYNRTKFVEERTKMMQAWADYLDKLKQGAEVVPFRRA